MIELCIPSSLDPTLAPRGCHVISLFTQYTPYALAGGQAWSEQERNAYADRGKARTPVHPDGLLQGLSWDWGVVEVPERGSGLMFAGVRHGAKKVRHSSCPQAASCLVGETQTVATAAPLTKLNKEGGAELSWRRHIWAEF